MNALPAPTPIAELSGPIGEDRFQQIRAEGTPVVIRDLVTHWPAIAAAKSGDEAIVAYLQEGGISRPVNAIAAAPTEQGRFFYNADCTSLNFTKGRGQFATFLGDLLHAGKVPDPPAMALQSELISDLIPAFYRDNRLDLLPHVEPRIWIGNRIRVAPHFDIKENVACCVSGRRRFTVFSPEQTGNLYPGPFEVTPAGTPVSMVDLADPDLDAHPRFAQAAQAAQQSTLSPGDAIYIPYGWWHGVESLDPVSILVNYWWTDGQLPGLGGHYDALLHALMSYKHLPKDQREVWHQMINYYVFETSGDPAAHLPEVAKGVLGPPQPGLFNRIREMLRSALH